jgi:hypothetical protein
MAVLPLIKNTGTPKNTRLDGVEDDDYLAKLARQSDPDNGKLNNIDWLGSSYSGADIKVVAHLYQKQKNHWLEDHQAHKEFAEKAVEALEYFIGGGLLLWEQERLAVRLDPVTAPAGDFSYLKDLWLNMAFGGSVEPGSPVSDFMLGFFWKMMDPRAGVYQINITRQNMIKALAEQRKLQEYHTERVQQYQKLAAVGTSTQVLGSLQTLAVQTHREKYGVRSLGKSYVKGYTRGPRTIAGSMIFTVFEEHPLTRLIKAMGASGLYGESYLDTDISTLIPDQLPPIDLTIIFANEYGKFSRMSIYGVEFMNDSQTYSIEDLMTEGVMNFVARDIDIMTSIGMMRLSRAERGIFNDTGKALTASELLITGKGQYEEYIKKLGIRRGLVGR